ncbi:MAG: transposase [Deltaproteobacteria bacterium]|nr:transposase [Deltaproteobacteria bacterium]
MPARMNDNSENKIWIYHRRLPHWRLGGSTYFVTWRLNKFQEILTPAERELIVSTLKHFETKRFDLFAYVVMPDHIHLLIRPYEKYLLHQIVHSWKSYSANRLQREYNREGRIWQEDYFDRIMRDESEFLEKAQYILNNPLKVEPQDINYPWVWVFNE